MDMALDDIVSKSQPKRGMRRRGRGGAKAALGGRAAAVNAAATKAVRNATVTGKPAAPATAQTADKIMVSGLPTDVNEAQIKELFTTTVGPLKDIQLHYNASGKWNGSATVHFSRKGDGAKAYEAYNNRLIDRKKPMRIEVILDPARVPPPSLVNRVAPAPAARGAAMEGVQRTGGRPRRGRGGGGGKKNPPKPQKTAADLDTEMDDYTAEGSNIQPSASAGSASA